MRCSLVLKICVKNFVMMDLVYPFFAECFAAILALFAVAFACFENHEGKKTKIFSITFCFAIAGALLVAMFVQAGHVNGLANAFFEKTMLTTKIQLVILVVYFMFLAFTIFNKIYSFSYIALSLLSLCGSLLLICSSNLLSVYLALELQSIPLYIILTQNKTLSSKNAIEGAVKYFIMSSLFSCFFIYACSLFYANFATLSLGQVASGAEYGKSAVLSVIFILFAFCGKLSLAPFYFWAPDLYQKTTKSSLFFISSISKLASVCALFTIFRAVFNILTPQDFSIIVKVLTIIIALSFAVGSFGGLAQQNIKRLLAYSGIINAAFFVCPLFLMSVNALRYSLFYIVIYALNTFVVLACLSYLKQVRGYKFKQITDLALVYKYHPFIAFYLLCSVLSIVGLPPFAGFFTKFFILKSIFAVNLPIFVIALLGSVVASFYYLSILKAMYFAKTENTIFTTSKPAKINFAAIFIISICFVITILNFAISLNPSLALQIIL